MAAGHGVKSIFIRPASRQRWRESRYLISHAIARQQPWLISAQDDASEAMLIARHDKPEANISPIIYMPPPRHMYGDDFITAIDDASPVLLAIISTPGMAEMASHGVARHTLAHAINH